MAFRDALARALRHGREFTGTVVDAWRPRTLDACPLCAAGLEVDSYAGFDPDPHASVARTFLVARCTACPWKGLV